MAGLGPSPPKRLREGGSNPEAKLWALDCFVAEPVIGPAFGRTRRLLAM